MVFLGTQPKMFYNSQSSDVIPGNAIKSFLGTLWYEGHNILNLQPGELLYNKNMEYRFSGTDKYMNTRRGSTLIADTTNYSVGANNFIQGANKYFVYVDSIGTLNAIGSDKTITQIATSIDISNWNDSFYYGLSGNETTYFCNPVDGIYKVTNTGSFSKATVLARPIESMCYSNISGRMIASEGHRANYSNVQNQTAIDTSNLEKFDDQDWILINPTEGEKIYKTIDNGEITFFMKDTGIWALINANEDPKNWIVPKCNADIGTKSPQTVKYSRYGQQEGFIYLGADRTLRYMSARVVRNSGVSPTLEGGDSRVISKPFQKLLNDIPDEALIRCTATYFQRYYILCVPSAGNAALNMVIVVDTDKLMQSGESDIPQPYWFLSDKNLAKTDFVIQGNELYGFSPDGYLSKMFVEDIYYDEMPDRMYVYDGTTLPEYMSSDYLSITEINNYYKVGTTITQGTSSAKIVDYMQGFILTNQAIGQFTNGDIYGPYQNDIVDDFLAALLYNMDLDSTVTYTGATDTTTTVPGPRTVDCKYYSSHSGVTDYAEMTATTGIPAKDIILSFWSDGIASSGSTKYFVTGAYGQVNRISVFRISSLLFVLQSDGVNTNNYSAYVLSNPGMANFTIFYKGTTGTISLYVNGVLKTPGSTSINALNSFNLGNLYVGNAGTNALNCSVLDLSLFNYDSLIAKYTESQIAGYLANNTFNNFILVREFTTQPPAALATITNVVRRVAIPYSIYTGWYKFSENELLLYDVYVNWKAYGYCPLYMMVNSFTKGASIPDFDNGQVSTLYPDNILANKESFSNAAFISNKGQLSQNYGKELRGNYFCFGFYNNNYNQPATLYSLEPMFKSSKLGPMGNNK